MRTLIKIFIAILLVTLSEYSALAQKRIALVIGNSQYIYAGTLANPVNDASDMAAVLKTLGFTVVAGYDLDKAGLEKKIREFARALAGADTGVFFYAGHGLQVAGVNYIVPVDAELTTTDALEFEMVKLESVQRIMENAAKTNILFLDACRNNPLARNLARALGTRGSTIGVGLAPAESGIGTLISFSTQPGNVASDGAGRNSPYTGPLVKRIATRGEDILTVLTAVRNEVLEATGDRQVPWENHALRSKYYFNPGAQTKTETAPPLTSPQPPLNEAAQAWDRIKEMRSIAVFESFRRQYGAANQLYDTLAAERIEELKRAQVATSLPPRKPDFGNQSSACAGGLLVSVATGPMPCLKPGSGESFKDCPECPEMVIVPAGAFRMGSPKTEPERYKDESDQQETEIPRPIAAGRFAVTFAEWDFCVAEGGCNGYKPDDGGWGRYDRPVINVNWNDAIAYTIWLSKKTGKAYRLLTEAEREYITRAGTETPFWWGKSITPEQANYNGETTYGGGGSKGENREKTLPVKYFQPNPWGLYQVHGNVWEWTNDCWTESDAPGTGRSCNRHVLRGGSWSSDPRSLRAAFRNAALAVSRQDNVSFRVARSLNPQS